MGSVQQLLLLLLACLWPSLLQAQTANVSNSEQLLRALQSPAKQIVLQNDVALGTEFMQFEGAPLPIQRNVTLTGAAGNRSGVDARPVIDLQNKVGVLQLCSNCTFLFLYVSIANENRAGTGGGISAFRGLPGSKVEWIGGVGLRPACPPTASALSLLANTQRSARFEDPGGKQLVGSTNFTYRGRQYVDMLLVGDLTTDVVPAQLTNSTFTGGYAIRRANATRLCDNIVSSQCLERRLPEDCIAELLAGNSSNSSSAGSGSLRSVVAIAVPAAVGGALIIAAGVALLLWQRRVRKRRKQQRAALGHQKGALPGGPDPSDLEALGDQGIQGAQSTQDWSSAVSQQGSGRRSLQQAAVSGEGWQLLWASSAGGADTEAKNDIELGLLLGAGSFARVYKGRWSGLDVAVKVIHHDLETAKDVANEVQLMLNLNHPNIVRAYHCVTKQMLPEQARTPAAAAGSSADSVAGPAAGLHGASSAPQATATAEGVVWGATVPTSGSAPGSFGQPVQSSPLVPHTPTASDFSYFTSAQQQQQQHQHQHQHQHQQGSHTVVVQDPGSPTAASYVPIVGLHTRADNATGGTPAEPVAIPHVVVAALPHVSATTAGLSVSTTALFPATPPPAGAAVLPAAALASASVPTTTTGTSSTQHGVLSSSGLTQLAQDLDTAVLQAYQRRQAYQQQEMQQQSQQRQRRLSPLPSAASGDAGIASLDFNATARTVPFEVPGGTSSPPHAALQQPADAGLVPAAGTAGAALGGQTFVPFTAGSASSRGSLPGSAGSQSAWRTVSQQQQGLLPARQFSGAAPMAGSVTTSSGAGSSTSRPWHIMGTGSLSEVQPPSDLGSAGFPGGGTTGGTGTSSGSVSRVAGPGAMQAGCAPAAMCETWLVTELCDRGTLARQAAEWNPEHNEQDMLRLLHLLRDVARGLKLLNTQHIVHADLNSHNVLVSSSSVARHGLVAKVADLGLSRVLKQHATHRTTGTVGMLTHQPPELMRDGRLSPAVDIYSFGIMMYEVFTRQAAHSGLRVGQIYHQVVVLGHRPAVPSDMPEDYELIMRRCWASEPGDRPSVDMLLECLDLMIEDRQGEQGHVGTAQAYGTQQL